MKKVSREADAAGLATIVRTACTAASTGAALGEEAFDLALAGVEVVCFTAAFDFFGAALATVFFAFLAAFFAVFFPTFLTVFLTAFFAAFLAFATRLPFLARVFFAAGLADFAFF